MMGDLPKIPFLRVFKDFFTTAEEFYQHRYRVQVEPKSTNHVIPRKWTFFHCQH